MPRSQRGAWNASKNRQSELAGLGDFDCLLLFVKSGKATARPPHSKSGDVVAPAAGFPFAQICRAVTVESAGLKTAATYAIAEKDDNPDCVAGAQRYFDLVRDWGAALVGGSYKMVLRRGAGGGIAASWGLLAHGVCR